MGSKQQMIKFITGQFLGQRRSDLIDKWTENKKKISRGTRSGILDKASDFSEGLGKAGLTKSQ